MDVNSDNAASIKDIIARIDAEKDFDPAVKEEAFDTLEAFECWDPLFKLLRREITHSNKKSIGPYIRLARIQHLFLEDVFAAAETCSQAVGQLRLSYRQFVEQILSVLFEQEDYPSEATVVQASIDRFHLKADQISALERLCLLYEKKTLNETQLNESYRKLLQLDPLNVKALRYFKLLFTQNYEWEKVIAILRSLIKANKHPRDVFRVAQELAAVLLYQLDQPREAIAIINDHCEGSPLDTSTITYDAYQRLGDWRGCLKVLRECLISVSDPATTAVIHFRIGQLEEKIGSKEDAAKEYEKAISLDRKFFEAFEQLIGLKLLARDWNSVVSFLERLEYEVDDEGSRLQLQEARQRLLKGITHAEGR